MRHFSENFKKAVIRKVLIPGVQQNEVALKLNISLHTLRKWKGKYGKELKLETERDFLDSIQPEEEEEVDIDSLLREYERTNLSKNELNLESAIDKIIEKGTNPIDYSHKEKYVMVRKVRSLKPEEHGIFFRRTGIHSGHITLWEEELLQMAKEEVDKSDYIKKLEEENKKLQKQLKGSEREKKELKVLIGLKKKYQSLFKEDEEN